MPPGHEPFLAAVCAAPWDDLPRLVFADWLEDHGEYDRAEFIRLQCGVGTPMRRDDPRWKRADELSRRHVDGWRAELPALSGVGWGRFCRGFVGSATLVEDESTRRLSPTLFAAAPVQTLVVQNTSADGFRHLAGCRVVNRVSRLRIDRGWWRHPAAVDDDGVVLLAGNPAWSGLTALNLDGRLRAGDWPVTFTPGLSDRSATALAVSTHLSRLRTLRIRGITLTADGRAALTRRFGRGLDVID